MSDAIFTDKARQPTGAELAVALGPAAAAWERVVGAAAEICPKAAPTWKHYAGKSGWVLVFRDKKRNVLYLSPREKSFTAALAFNEQAVAAAETAGLPAGIVQQLRDSPVYPEGRAVRISVRSARQAATVVKLLTVKAAT